MTPKYSDEKNVQVLIYLLKANNIRKIVASPGSTNMTFVASVQRDSFFEVFSSVDERSAAYIACGIAAESMEPVVLSCTGATASRNYFSGLTEAYYRKLPLLSITSHQGVSKIGQNIAQVLDVRVMPKDTAKMVVDLPFVKSDDDLWDCELKVNKAILELSRNGGGPVHINLYTKYSLNYEIYELPKFRKIKRINAFNQRPNLPKGNIAIFIGSHLKFNTNLVSKIERFCEKNNAAVFCDHTSSYNGKYRLQFALEGLQVYGNRSQLKPCLLIHIGEITGDYYSLGLNPKQVWRVSPDGEIKDLFKKLTHVFEMPEDIFFEDYLSNSNSLKLTYFNECENLLNNSKSLIPDLPFSNIWIASILANKIPENSVIHFAILNSLRSWNFFELPISVSSFSNVGGFGIDGCLSSLVGASIVNNEKLYFGIIGDLAFFYDINVLGNRHIKNNLRVMVVNNGKGTEFRHNSHFATKAGLSDIADDYIAAGNHFGNKSKTLVKNFSENLGFEYLSADNKEQFISSYPRFIEDNFLSKSIIFEVFTNSEDETYALQILRELNEGKLKNTVKKIAGRKLLNKINSIKK